jgi:hypothetical protein
MKTSWEERARKAEWARKNPEKVRQMNRNYRFFNEKKCREQAKIRMRRMRARRRAAARKSIQP